MTRALRIAGKYQLFDVLPVLKKVTYNWRVVVSDPSQARSLAGYPFKSVCRRDSARRYLDYCWNTDLVAWAYNVDRWSMGVFPIRRN